MWSSAWSRAVVVSAVVGVASDATAQVRITEPGGHVSEATITVNASSREVYRLVTDYARWPTVFSDIRSVRVESGGPRDARVRFSSRVLDRSVTVKFDNVEDRLIRFRGVKGPPGGKAGGSYELIPIDGGARTTIRARLYMDVTGVASLFVSGREVRRLRQAKLRADAADLGRMFAHVAHR